MKLAKVQLTYAVVTAPQAGVVSAVAANAGQNASPGKTIATIADTRDLFVRVFVPETRIGDVKIGAAATVKTDSSDATYPGKVEFIASQAEFTPDNVETKDQRIKLVYEVRVRLDRTSGGSSPACPRTWRSSVTVATDILAIDAAALCARSAKSSRSTASTSTVRGARCSGCSARTARASRRSSGCSRPCSRPTRATRRVFGESVVHAHRRVKPRIGYMSQRVLALSRPHRRREPRLLRRAPRRARRRCAARARASLLESWASREFAGRQAQTSRAA